MTHACFPRTVGLMYLVSGAALTVIAAACGGGSATPDGPPSIPLVDLFGQDGIEVSDSPTLSTPPRAGLEVCRAGTARTV